MARVPRPAVGPRVRRLLAVVMVTAGVLAANSIYLALITFVEWATGRTLQNYFYQYMFLAHLVLGLVIVVPFVVFVVFHFLAARHRRNRLALRTGYALAGASIALLATGLILVRFGWFEIRDPRLRAVAYWLHAALPLAAASLYVWHRERGGRFRVMIFSTSSCQGSGNNKTAFPLAAAQAGVGDFWTLGVSGQRSSNS